MKTIKVLLSGGFHNSGEITIRAKIETKIVTVDRPLVVVAQLSDSQVRKIQRHFCGIADCTCGGVGRADCELPGGWEINGSLSDPTATHFVKQ